MDKKVAKYLITAFACLAVLFPVWVRLSGLAWSFDRTLLLNLFPAFGLISFSVLWLHSMGGVFEPWLRRYINFDRFVHNTSITILISMIMHPLLLLITAGFNFNNIFLDYGAKYIWYGIIAWLLLITYDVGKALKKQDFFGKNWNNILIISTIGFLISFFHSLALGSDLQSGALRSIWVFYGTTAIIAAIYTYGVKRFLK